MAPAPRLLRRDKTLQPFYTIYARVQLELQQGQLAPAELQHAQAARLKILNHLTQLIATQYRVDETTARTSAEQAADAMLPAYDLDMLRAMIPLEDIVID